MASPDPFPDPAAPADADLVRAWRAGDATAFRALLDRHEPALRTWLDRNLPGSLRRRVSSDDLLQEAYLVAVRRGPEFEDRGEGSFRAWLRRIAELKLREAIDHHLGAAKRGGDREVTRGARPDTAQFAAGGPTPSELAIAGELRDAVRRATERLRPDDREIVRLVQVDGLTIEQCAARLGRTSEAARKLYSRALARFARLLDEERGRP
jgi:RNA polymerase sigma-70 factor (ECF subfamily)